MITKTIEITEEDSHVLLIALCEIANTESESLKPLAKRPKNCPKL